MHVIYKTIVEFIMRYLFLPVLLFLITSATTDSRHNYPIPEKTKERLFFIQRNLNSNTIVYDARFDKHGNLNESSPMDIYWIRYDEYGQRMELRTIEKNLAFGIEFSKLNNYNYYKVNIVAEKNRDIHLKQTAPFEAKAFVMINNRMSQLNYLYLVADDTGFLPELKSIEYFGTDTLTKRSTYEKVLY